MSSFTFLFLACLVITIAQAAEKCPTTSPNQSNGDLSSKYAAVPIVAYGTVVSVANSVVKFQPSCTLKGQLSPLDLDLTQPAEVTNITECHYLALNKSYIIFLQPAKTNFDESKPVYELANIEEIEIDDGTLTKFATSECSDKQHYGVELTLFYFDDSRKCGQLNTVCDETSAAGIRDMNYKTFTKSTKFLGGFKSLPNLPISGKSGSGVGDEQTRSAASIFSLSFATFIIALLFKL